MKNEIAAALLSTLVSPNESDRNMEPANLVDAIYRLARGADHIGDAIHKLGNADASTPMGAIEAHGLAVREGASEVAEAIRELADAIRASTEAKA